MCVGCNFVKLHVRLTSAKSQANTLISIFTTTKMNTDPIKAKIQELCPDVMATHECNCPSAEDIVGFPITLAVVLRAIPKKGKTVKINDEGTFFTGVSDEMKSAVWDLKHDNYDQQSEECKQFIGSLLNV